MSLEAALLNGAAGATGQPSFSCASPASRCTYDDFSTLGFCASVINMTERTTSSCQISPWTYAYLDCTYDFPNQSTYIGQSLSTRYGIPLNNGNDDSTHFLSTTGPNLTFASVKSLSTTIGDFDKGPPVEVFAVQWYWCELNFHNVTSLPGHLPTQTLDSIKLDAIPSIPAKPGEELKLTSRKTGKELQRCS